MKRMITASVENPNQLPITKLTEDELRLLPDKVLLRTALPGPSHYVPVFKVVDKSALSNPDKCFIIDSYWGYASGRDVYLASRKDVETEKARQLSEIEKQFKNYARYAL